MTRHFFPSSSICFSQVSSHHDLGKGKKSVIPFTIFFLFLYWSLPDAIFLAWIRASKSPKYFLVKLRLSSDFDFGRKKIFTLQKIMFFQGILLFFQEEKWVLRKKRTWSFVFFSRHQKKPFFFLCHNDFNVFKECVLLLTISAHACKSRLLKKC